MPFMAAIPIGYMMAATAAVGAASAISSANAQKKSADYNAAEATQGSHIAADTAGENAIADQHSNRMQLGSQAAALAQAGIGTGGTGGMALKQSGVNAQLNEMNIQYGGVENSTAMGNQSTLDTMQGQQAQSNGYMSAAGQLFGGAGSYYKYANNPAMMAPSNSG